MLQDPPATLCSPLGTLPGFQLFRPTRGGHTTPDPRPQVVTAVHQSLVARTIPFHHPRVCGAFVTTSRGPLACISMYIRHTDGQGISALAALLSKARNTTPFVLVGGDGNGHSNWWGPSDQATNRVGEELEDLITSHSLEVLNQLPSPPTFTSDRGFEAWLDITLASRQLCPSLLHWEVVNAHLDSDHRAISSSFSVTTTISDHGPPQLDWRQVDWDTFRALLQSRLSTSALDIAPLTTTAHLTAYYSTLETALGDTIATCVPTKRPCSASNPWWNKDLEALRLELQRLRRRWTRTKTREDKQRTNACRRRLRQAIASAKQDNWRQFCEDAADDDFWDLYQKLTRSRRTFGVGDLFVDGQLLSDDRSKAEALADRFFPSTLPPDEVSHLATHSRAISLLHSAKDAPVAPVTCQEVHAALWSSGPWKAPGQDHITFACLRECESLLLPHFLRLFTASLQLQFLPDAWKSARVIAVPKPHGDPSSPRGFRPISLLPCISKLLEKVVTERLTYHLESNNLLSEDQFGFRRAKSTEAALWNFVNAASTSIRQRAKTLMVTLDIQSAYDKVWHDGLIAKLDDMQVPTSLLGWIGAFISHRRAHIQVGQAHLHRNLCMGVPQGSPLSPILFLIFVDDLLRALQPHVHAQAYADDIVIWWPVPKGESGETLGLHALRIIEDWAHRWKVTFNASKCHPMMISHLRGDPSPTLQLNGEPLPLVSSLRYLGVELDARLTWKDHIRITCAKATTRLRAIRRGAATMWGTHPHILLHMIRGAVLPVLFYAAPTWCPVVGKASLLCSIDRVLRLCGIAALGLLRTVSGDAARTLAGLLPAEFYIRQATVEFYIRHITYGVDLLPRDSIGGPSLFTTPCCILRKELRRIDRCSTLSAAALPRAESRPRWYADPSTLHADFSITILEPTTASECVHEACAGASPDELWVFTDGALAGLSCGMSAVLVIGNAAAGTSSQLCAYGQHSRVQTKLAALRLGCQQALAMGPFRQVTLLTDSLPALRDVSRLHRGSSLAVETRSLLTSLSTPVSTVRLWWAPSHALAAALATDATSHASPQDTDILPLCPAALRAIIRRIYRDHASVQWDVSNLGRDLHAIEPKAMCTTQWTRSLTRREVALVAQFLTGHYATNMYLLRFGHETDGSCDWCDALTDDRHHRLLECPFYESARQHLTSRIQDESRGAHGWTWDYLTGPGRRFLARFLQAVDRLGALPPE